MLFLYYLSSSEIWPDKKGGLWWEGPGKKGGLWWEGPGEGWLLVGEAL